ncbi:hypothetical protein D9756_004446 [Leucocoprinus leucothites]|uniref:Mug135-like C-terminal domain-containing protein n=1 Tax=Leucocoprinus leucothites TaxID=201217 RepID=A0A8H5LKN8_9AGAR|nr:hypothetical protein D9756_004446 [Leucoagaricus leucothites]
MMAARIPLPRLNGNRTRELFPLPPAPSVPPSILDVTEAAHLARDLVRIHGEIGGNIPDEDLVNGITYAAKVVAARSGLVVAAEGDEGPPARLPAIEAALRQMEERLNNRFSSLDRRVARVERLNARASFSFKFNAERPAGDGAVYEVVPFADGTYPDDYDLPPLTSLRAVRDLTPEQLTEYYHRYANRPRELRVQMQADDIRCLILEFIDAQAAFRRARRARRV